MNYPKLPDLATRFRWARNRKGLTQMQLAELAGVTRDVIARIETGQTQQPRNIKELATMLDVAPAWLMFGNADIDQLTEDGIAMALAYESLSREQQQMVDKLIQKLRDIQKMQAFLDED